MRILRVVNSLTFRFIARYITALVTAVFAVMILLYAYVSYAYFRDLGASIDEELDTLEIVYRGQALPGLRQYFRDQMSAPRGASFSYLVTDEAGDKLAGDLVGAPRYREFSGGWLRFQEALFWGSAPDVDFLARSRELDSGVRALVAYNFASAAEIGSQVFGTLARAMVLTFILGIIGGFITASFALRRLEDFSQRLSRIVRENPGARMPVEGEDGYLRELSLVTNSMLDQITLLMQGVKHVSDNIAHDLRTPLTRIRNQLNQLHTGLDPAGQAAVDHIIEDCDDLLASFNALLRISTLESGTRSAAEQALDLAGLLGDVVELYEPLANEKGIRLALAVPASLSFRGDSDLLFQLFANLVDNAIKYTPAGGNIAVSLQARESGAASVEVRDSGPGIPAADRKNVFRRFYRLEASRGRQPGHGLGLSLVQAIVQYHRGDITLGDNRPGLRVIVTLPGEK